MSALFQLFELLGFDRFEFIQSLLQNRRSVIECTLEGGVLKAPKVALPKLQEPQRPNYGCQVVIQV